MKHTIDLKKYNLRTDLIIENNTEFQDKTINNYDNVTISIVNLDEFEAKLINKKKGTYITIEFDDITDSSNMKKVEEAIIKCLKIILKDTIKRDFSCLIVGLGNIDSTPDSLGPKVISQITVTRHLFLIGDVDSTYNCISAFIPGVTGNTGIETSELIKNAIDSVKPDFIIVIDALASSSIERLNKTIQITDTGISPGSGIGNSRKEISYDTYKVPVIAIGVPTVVDAVSVVSDTINYMHKNYAFNKKYLNSPINRLISSSKINYLKEKIEIEEEDKSYLLGLVGTLNEKEIRQLIYEVLTPIGYNLMVTPKEVDFEIRKLSEVISNSINKVLKKTTE